MKRFILIFKILLPLLLLLAYFLPGCDQDDVKSFYCVEASKGTVVVGEKVTLTVRLEEQDPMGCSRNQTVNLTTGIQSYWPIDPSDGATVKNGVFVASKPGTYEVSWNGGSATTGNEDVFVPATIVVQGTAAEDTAEDDADESTEPEETSAESETTSTETDANLIHGVVPTKVTAHIIGCSVPPGESVDAYMEFWNVGKLGGEQYSKTTLTETAENKTTKSEGYFTGGPNGLFHLTSVSEGGTCTREFGLLNGKVINPGYIIPVDNPEAFDGWVD